MKKEDPDTMELTEVDMEDIEVVPPIRRKHDTKPPPPPQGNRRLQQTTDQIVARLQQLGWTEIGLRIELPAPENKPGFYMRLEGSFSYGNTVYAIRFVFSRKGQIIVERIIKDNPPERKGFTPANILERGRTSDKEVTVEKLQKHISEKVYRLLEKLVRILQERLKIDNPKRDISLWFIHDILEQKFSFQVSLAFPVSDSPSHTSHRIEGSHDVTEKAIDSPETQILNELNGLTIRGVDPLCTLLGMILRQEVKERIAQSLPDAMEDLKDSLLDPQSELRVKEEGSRIFIVALLPDKRSS